LNEMLGYEEGELLGLDHWLVYHPDYQELTRKRAQTRMLGKTGDGFMGRSVPGLSFSKGNPAFKSGLETSRIASMRKKG